jgi:Uma2 family endonuclease
MNAPALTRPQRTRLRIEDFLLLDRSGAFGDASKTELLDGDIYCMNSQFQRHSYVKSEIAFRLREILAGTGRLVLVEAAVAMPPHDLPEPDVTVMQGPLGTGAVPLDRVRLLVEVSDSTLDIDLGRKADLYARNGVPEYWVADIEGRQIWVHREPAADGYCRRESVAMGEPVEATTLGVTIATDGLV